MRQTGRISISSSCCEWLAVLLLISPTLTATQYASPLYNRQFYDHNSQQQVHQQQQQQPSVYPDIPVTYNQQYPATGQSIWSSAPIVVTEQGNRLDGNQDRRYLPINYYNNRETYSTIEPDNNYDNYNNYNNVPTTRAANHNYNNAPGHFYYTQQPQPQSQQELEQRELLAVADSRREEEQIVRIGGNRSLAPNNYSNNNPNNYFEPPQSLSHRDFEAKYAKHYSDYLRKYPQRLQPLYNTGASYVDK
ncbi:probable serine/threonine-protein kinase cdc7 [Drosophila innubila]|uniref:probable serine/threonine-protein kinase cdc7 n=1 Tax=Drosophila innubila TaxID=198719 RepID=UPI00148CF191|nr:probable serine/threonine-protein kinase cdc7 [Drosophila innubila]